MTPDSLNLVARDPAAAHPPRTRLQLHRLLFVPPVALILGLVVPWIWAFAGRCDEDCTWNLLPWEVVIVPGLALLSAILTLMARILGLGWKSLLLPFCLDLTIAAVPWVVPHLILRGG